MATPEELERAPETMLHRLAEAVEAAEDAGADPQTLTSEIADQIGQHRWAAVVVADPSVTAEELMTAAEVLDTSPTFLLTGREPEPTTNAEIITEETA